MPSLFGKGGGAGSSSVQDGVIDPEIYDATTPAGTGDATAPGVITAKKGKRYRIDNSKGSVTLKTWASPVLGEAAGWIDINGSVTTFVPLLIDSGPDLTYGAVVVLPAVQTWGSGRVVYMGTTTGFALSY